MFVVASEGSLGRFYFDFEPCSLLQVRAHWVASILRCAIVAIEPGAL